MISKITDLPRQDLLSAERIKLQNLFSAYPDEMQLFIQTKTGAVISKLGGDVIISGKTDDKEVKQFLSFIRPQSVFSSADNLTALFGGDFECVNVVLRENCLAAGNNMFSYDFSSREAYDLLKTDRFCLPDYEFFATDYCRRKNKGLIKVFGKRDTCIAITLEDDNCRMLSGIVSRQKGQGGSLLLSAVSGNLPVLAVCRDELLPFYAKFGFTPLYKAGYWRKPI